MAAHAIAQGDAEIVVAGGMESMSNALYPPSGARKGLRMGDGAVVDSMVRDGLWCACEDFHMGMTGELVAEKHSITREQQDEYALASIASGGSLARGTLRRRGGSAQVKSRKGSVMVTCDESVREDASLECARRAGVGVCMTAP